MVGHLGDRSESVLKDKAAYLLLHFFTKLDSDCTTKRLPDYEELLLVDFLVVDCVLQDGLRIESKTSLSWRPL